MNQMQSKEPDSMSGTRRIWLLLLLLVLIVVLVTYDQGSARVYGEKAYTSATTLTEKATRWAKQLYECGLPGCKSVKTPAPATAANVQPNTPASAGKENTPSTTPAMPAPGNEQKSAWALAAPPSDMSSPGSQEQSGSQNYPSQAAYPAYPPSSAFGAGNAASGSAAPAAETPAAPAQPPQPPQPPVTAPIAAAAPATPAADSAQLPYLSPASPPVPPLPAKPVFATGKPEAPDYPVAPDDPAAKPAAPAEAALPPAASPSQPPQGLLPPPRVARPDQRQNQYQKSAPLSGRESNDGLSLARKSAQAGRLDESVHIYLHYLTVSPHDVNAYGVLCNVYFRMGRFSEAAQNYYEAATRLIDAGQMNAIVSLMPVIQMHEPMLANLLNQKIARATEGNRGQPR